MVTHAEARQILRNAAPGHSEAWYQATQAIALGEGGYGNGWKNANVVDQRTGLTFINRGEGSNNWGAIQCGHSTTPGGQCGPGCFPNLDHHADGSAYQGCFKAYATPEDGAADFLFVLTDNGNGKHNRASVADALANETGDGMLNADAIAGAMHSTGYFELSADKYAEGIVRHAVQIAQALGESQMVFRESNLPSDGTGSPVTTVCGLILFAVGGYVAAGGRLPWI